MEPWHFRFDRGNQKFHYRLYRRPGKGLIVWYPGLRQVGKTYLEYFNRYTWIDNIDCSHLFVADPGLCIGPTVRGTWFQGNKDFYAAEKVADDIRRISGEFGFAENRTVLYGSSQGGFAAMATGAYMKEASVLAECPQSDWRKFNMTADLLRAALVCYRVKTMAELPEWAEVRSSIISLYDHVGPPSSVKILVKETDTHCVDVHVKPLAEAYPAIDVEVFTGEMGLGGHSGLPKDKIVDEINVVVAKQAAVAVPAAAREEAVTGPVGVWAKVKRLMA